MREWLDLNGSSMYNRASVGPLGLTQLASEAGVEMTFQMTVFRQSCFVLINSDVGVTGYAAPVLESMYWWQLQSLRERGL